MASADVKTTSETVQPKFMSTRQVLTYLNISSSTLYQMMRTGDFAKPAKVANKNLWPRQYVENFARNLEAEFYTQS